MCPNAVYPGSQANGKQDGNKPYHGWPRASPQPLDSPLGQDSSGGGYHGLVGVCLGLHSGLYKIQGVCDASCYASADGAGCNLTHQGRVITGDTHGFLHWPIAA